LKDDDPDHSGHALELQAWAKSSLRILTRFKG